MNQYSVLNQKSENDILDRWSPSAIHTLNPCVMTLSFFYIT